MVTPWEEPKEPGSITTIPQKTTVDHCQHSNETQVEAHHNFENFATMGEALEHQVTETIEDTYIAELRNRYTGFMGVNMMAANMVMLT